MLVRLSSRTALLSVFLVVTAACSPAAETAAPTVGAPAESASSSTPTTTSTPNRASSSTPTPTPTPTPTRRPTMSESEAANALLTAAETGSAAQVQRALDAGAELETRNAERQTALVVATKAENLAAARVLLEAGADPNAKDAIEDSAFLYAGAEGYDDILRLTLVHGADVKSTNRFGGTALIPASEHGHTSTVKILIAAGVPLDHVNRLGWTALLEAIVLGTGSPDHVDVVRQLVAAGADVTVADKERRSPRSLAQARGYGTIVGLIDDADRVASRSARLITAAGSGDAERVTELLADGASVTARDGSGATALVRAAYGNHRAVARLLLDAGADPNVKDETVQSAYLVSTSEVGDDPRLLELLLEHGADVRSLDSWKGTGLIRAADRGFPTVVAALLEAGVAKDHVNRIGYTALHEAVVLGDGGASHRETVRVLVDAGVDRTVTDAKGRTALESAENLGYTAIAALLR